MNYELCLTMSKEDKKMTTATITSKGQITLPKAIRSLLHLRTGDKVDFQSSKDGSIRLIPVKKSVDEAFGCLSEKVKAPKTIEEMDAAVRGRFN